MNDHKNVNLFNKKKKKALIVHVTHREHIIFFKTNRLDFEDSGESTVCC